MFLFADLSLWPWTMWRLLSYVVYWIACLFAPVVAIGAVMGALAAGVSLPAVLGIAGCLVWLFVAYWLRRWLTGVTSVWPWMTPGREIRARERRAAG